MEKQVHIPPQGDLIQKEIESLDKCQTGQDVVTKILKTIENMFKLNQQMTPAFIKQITDMLDKVNILYVI